MLGQVYQAFRCLFPTLAASEIQVIQQIATGRQSSHIQRLVGDFVFTD
jgi:hypothetical protein